jgi:aminopeptidase N
MLPKIQKTSDPLQGSGKIVRHNKCAVWSYFVRFAFMLLAPGLLLAQKKYSKSDLDVLDYQIAIEVNDSNNRIAGKEVIQFKCHRNVNQISVDLQSVSSAGKGMNVSEAKLNGLAIAFKHQNNMLLISGAQLDTLAIYELELTYSGIPADGLVIGENMFGKRTFFGDNWPNRAHCWFACNDHPSDKATVSFLVHAPGKYDVIANGTLASVQETWGGMKKWKFEAPYVLPTKVMVVGIADFSTMELESTNGIPQSGWAYPEKKQQAFKDFKLAPSILDFYIQYFGEYPFDKLAHVQSTTRYGGMENASCIFYDETAIDGSGKCEDLLAHEMVHQWFGNTVTECDWPHVWLSEGFATYFTNVYIQKTKGQEAFLAQMRKDRQRIHSFSAYNHALVDTNYRQLTDLLNANSYQKGAWILHMLRNELGDEIFQTCIRSFYQKFKFQNACTDDFKQVIEEISGRSFDSFFYQWVYRAGHPLVHLDWKTSGKFIDVLLSQKNEPFQFPFELCVYYRSGEKELHKFATEKQQETFRIPISGKVKSIEFDPNVNLLYEEF